MNDTDVIKNAPSAYSRLYSTPRRFDITTIMVVTIAYSLLFSALQFMRFPPVVFAVTAGFFTCVGIAQALLFGGKKPRMSSLLVGVVYYCGMRIIDIALYGGPRSTPEFFVWLAVVGMFCGYLAGVAIASIFLISDYSRRLIRRLFHREA